MTESHDTITHKLVIDDAYKDSALQLIRKAITGNKQDASKITLKDFEGEVLQFQAETIIDVVRHVNEKTSYGRAQGSIVTDSEHSARDLINKEYLSLMNDASMIRQIRDVFINRKDKGFAKLLKVPLKFWHKSFIVHRACPSCNRAGTVRCNRCNGVGNQPCSRCYGSGFCVCNYCNGGQMVQNSSGGRTQCPTCSGRGKMSCPLCQQSGKIQCSQCSGKGSMKCSTCNGLAWISTIYEMTLEAITKFDYPRTKLPEKIVKIIERDPEQLLTHAEIHIAHNQQSRVNEDDIEKAKEAREAEHNKVFRIPVLYNVILPYSHLSFDMNDKTYYTFLFGVKGHIDHVSPFLDDLLKEAYRKIEDAFEKRGDAIQNLKAAAEYRTAKEAIYLSSQYGLSKAIKLLNKNNPIGLTEGMAKNLLQKSNIVLNNVTRTKRLTGLITGLLLTNGLLAGFFTTPLHSFVSSYASTEIIGLILDLCIVAACIYIGSVAIQSISGSAMRNALSKIIPNHKLKTISAKTGSLTIWHIGLSIIMFGAILESGRLFLKVAPMWYLDLLGQLLEFLY